jgi:hypothetical protein
LKSSTPITSTSLLIDSRTVHVDVPPELAFEPIRRIGGAAGWYYADWMWRARGWLDLLMGGIGFRRGRRDPDQLAVGDAVDCMRVEAFEPDRRLLLVFEMWVPGSAWLEFEVEDNHAGSSIRQTAFFEPQGMIGRAYWYLIYPFHQMVFAGMIRGIAERSGATRIHEPDASPG